jgi:hypothetical protein
MKKSYLLLGISLISNFYFAQGSPDYGDGLKVKLNEDGSKYFRVIAWAQGQVNYTDAAAANRRKNYLPITQSKSFNVCSNQSEIYGTYTFRFK